jgi:hypothetical protein
MKRLIAVIMLGVISIGNIGGCNNDSTANDMSSAISARNMFVHTADSGTLIAKEGEEEIYTLTLNGVANDVVSFVDNPERISKTIPINAFIAAFPLLAEGDEIQAALNISGARGDSFVLIVELLNAEFDEETSKLIYEVKKVAPENATLGLQYWAERVDNPPVEMFGTAGLYIDSAECKTTDYMPDVGDRFCGSATITVFAPFTEGGIGLKNVGDTDVLLCYHSCATVTESCFRNTCLGTNTLSPGEETCVKFEGMDEITFPSGEVEITFDSWDSPASDCTCQGIC